MSADEREAAIDRLDADWERFLRRGVLAPVRPEPDAATDPGLMETVRQLHTLDAEAAPPPLLADQVWRELIGPSRIDGQVGPLIGSPPPAPDVARWSANGPEPAAGGRPRRRWWPLIELAAVAAVVLALAGGVILERRAMQRLTAPSVEAPSGDVPMFHGNAARTGVMPGPGPAGEPVVRWRYRIESWEALSSPAVVDSVVYVGSSSGYVFAVDAATGEERWRFEADDPVMSSPAVAGDTVYFGSGEGFGAGSFHALDRATGVERWRFATHGTANENAPVIDAGIVYVTTSTGNVYALDGSTGAAHWTAQIGGWLNNPAVAGGTVYVTTMWETPIVEALDVATGESRWRVTLDPTLLVSAPAVAAGVVYVGVDPQGADDTLLIAFDGATGRELWRVRRAADPSGIPSRSTPAIAPGVVYFANGGDFYAVDAATGEEHWRVTVGSAVDSSPAVVDGTIYFGTAAGAVVALDAATGNERWRLPLGTAAAVSSSPAVVDGMVFVASDDTYLYAIGGTGDAVVTPP